MRKVVVGTCSTARLLDRIDEDLDRVVGADHRRVQVGELVRHLAKCGDFRCFSSPSPELRALVAQDAGTLFGAAAPPPNITTAAAHAPAVGPPRLAATASAA